MKVTIPFVWLVLVVGIAEASSIMLNATSVLTLVSPTVVHPSRHLLHVATLLPPTSVARTRLQLGAEKPKTTTAAPTKNTATTKVTGGQKLLTISSACGPSGATSDITASSGPNGSEEFLLCGLHGGGWNPAHVTVDDLVYKDLGDVLKQNNNPFSPCGNTFSSSINMATSTTESTCQANEVGGAGEQGLMQITKDKCEGRSPEACRDPSFNIGKGASYLRGLLDQHGGNVLTTLGGYNGMEVGAKAGSLLSRPACWQPNFDYLQQTLNGYIQGRDPQNNPRLGVYHNYDKCQG
ncbi:hypothetical protein BC629DRAFT_1436550 [Irpex lacteus]|nr:hypothetical protein BC629DRAFT_1436550 [Irpex lacteus]